MRKIVAFLALWLDSPFGPRRPSNKEAPTKRALRVICFLLTAWAATSLFSEFEGHDLSRGDLDAAIAGFVDAIKPGDTAVFVHSDHGWSDGTQNYLIGVDPRASAEMLARISTSNRDGAGEPPPNGWEG